MTFRSRFAPAQGNAPRRPTGLPGWVPQIEDVGRDPVRDPAAHRRRGRAVGLAPCLVGEAGGELGDEVEPRVDGEDLGAQLGRPQPGVAARDVDRRPDLEQVPLRVEGRVHAVPHVADDDLGQPDPALDRPARARGEHPGDVAAGLVERDRRVVERRHQPDVVEHRRDVQQLLVERDAHVGAARRRPQVRPVVVLHQRLRAPGRGGLGGLLRDEGRRHVDVREPQHLHRQYLRPRWRARSNVAVSATAITAIVPAWTGSLTTRSTWSVIEPTMLSAMIGMPDGAQLVGGAADLAAHDRAREHEQPGARQVGDGPHGGRDRLLADERDRVDGDPLAAQVVAVRLGHGAERDLGDLRPAAHDDHALAEDLGEGAGQADGDDGVAGPRARRSARARRRRRSRPRAPPPRSAGRRARGRPTAVRSTVDSVRTRPPDSADARRDLGHRPGLVDDLEVDGDGRRAAAAGVRPGIGGGQPDRPATMSLIEKPVGSRARRVVLVERRPERGEGLARRVGVARREHQRARRCPRRRRRSR